MDRDDAECILSTFTGIHERRTPLPDHCSTAEYIIRKYAEMSFPGWPRGFANSNLDGLAEWRPQMTDAEKLAFDAVKEIITNFLYLSLGVFALVGGFLTSAKKELEGKRTLVVALGFFGASICCGGLALMLMTGQVIGNAFNPTDAGIRFLSAGQIACCGIGCVLFYAYMCLNLWSTKP